MVTLSFLKNQLLSKYAGGGGKPCLSADREGNITKIPFIELLKFVHYCKFQKVLIEPNFEECSVKNSENLF